jgi:cell wall-associated NlpC family hydrolase
MTLRLRLIAFLSAAAVLLLVSGCGTLPVYKGAGIACVGGKWASGVSAGSGGPSNSTESSLMSEIDSWMGTPYQYGGESRSGVDCSGFTQAVYGSVGVEIPRTASQQAAAAQDVNPGSLDFGDLLFFNTSGSGISHVGIYIGNGFFAHSSSSQGVVRESLAKEYYATRIVSAGRVL